MKHLFVYKKILLAFWLVVGIGFSMVAQQVVSGIIKDEEGLPLPGVTVRTSNSAFGATTDINGAFTINVPAGTKLVVSHIGYGTKEVEVTGQNITIDMAPSAGALGEVMVTALGIQREKKALGYSAQNVSGEAASVARETNIANTLSGKVAGLQISRSPGGLGASSRIVIRGNNSLGRTNQPLIVVDGVPINNFNTNSAIEWGGSDRGMGLGDINPDDVENMTVLKGPEATALYGVQGGNGAIIISTKKGRARKGIGVQVNSNLTFENALFLPEVQTQYAQGAGGVFDLKSSSAWGPSISGQQVDDWRNPGQKAALSSYDNRFSDFLQTGQTFSNSVALNGGNDKTGIYLSYTNVSAKGILPTSTLGRNVANLRIDHKLNNWISIDGKVTYTQNKGFNRPRLSGDPENAYGQVLYLPGNVNVKDLDPPTTDRGALRIWNPGGSNVIQNPYWSLRLNTNEDVRDRFLTLLSTNIKFTSWLNLMLRHSMDYFSEANQSQLAYGQRYNEPTGNFAQDRTTARTVNSDFLLSAYKRFGTLGAKLSLGGNRFDVNNNTIYGANNGNLVPGFYNLGAGLNDRRSLSNSIWRKRINSVYVLGSFDYNSWAYVEASYRTDWSSTLPTANRKFSYPSVSTSFILSDLFSMPSYVSLVKLRAAYAQAGNDVDPFELQPTYGIGSGAGAIVSGVPTRIFNPDLRPEIITSRELGIEARFWHNRAGFELSLYQKNARDQRIFLPVPSGSGFGDRIINGGNVQNAGVELVFNFAPIRKTDGLRWDIDLNFARNRNKIIELHPDIKRYLLYGPRAVFMVADEGQLFGDIYGRGIQTNASGQVVVDKDGLPLLTATKDVKLGNVQPNWLGGINNTIAYKNLSLSFLIDIRNGGSVYSETMSSLYAAGLATGTVANRDGGWVVEGVTETGERNSKAIKAEQYWARVAGANNSAAPFIYDVSNAMLRELILGYRLPNRLFTDRSVVRDASLSLVGRNLFLISKNANTPAFVLDSSFSTGNDIGMESGSLPQTRSFGLNLRLNF